MLIYLAPILVFTPGYRIGKRRHDIVLEDIKLLAENNHKIKFVRRTCGVEI